MLLLIHERDEGRDRSALIDALTVTLALATLLWVYLISPYADGHSMSTFARLTSIGYPAMDILVVGVLARMAAGSHRREPAFVFMLSGVVVLLLSDAIYGWRLLESHYTPGPVTMAGWAIFYALLGTAAMHPSMRKLAEPGPRSSSTLTRARLALLACASLTVPLVIVVRGALGEHLDLYVLVGASAAMFSLVLLRMAGILRRHEEVTGREAALRIELAEESLNRRSEERLSALIKNSSDVVCILGADARVRWASPSLERTLGHDPEQIVGRELLEIVHPEDTRRLRSLIAAIAAQPAGQRSLVEFRAAKAGEDSWRDVEALGLQPAGGGERRGDRAEPARRQRAQGLPERARAPGLPRHPLRAAQPGAVPQPRRARAARPPPRPPAGRRAVPRRRRLQVRQRLARSRRRRRGAPGGRPTAAGLHAPGRHRRTARRRRVRDPDPRHRERAALDRDRQPRDGRAEGADRARRTRRDAVRQRRDRLLRPAHGLPAGRRRAAAQRRRGDVHGQGEGQGHLPAVQPRDPRSRDGADGAEGRTAARARRRRVHAALPADHGPRAR